VSRALGALRATIWSLLQVSVGGTYGKRKLALRFQGTARRVLEMGCATGNVSEAFAAAEIDLFVGVDIDPHAIAHAQRKFAKHPHMDFRCIAFEELDPAREQFDYILVAGVLHHLDDDQSGKMLCKVAQLLAPKGRIVVSEPLAPGPESPLLERLYGKIERGSWLRTEEELLSVIRSRTSLQVRAAETHPVAPFRGERPVCAQFVVACLERPDE
jgi:2-polyprenyl-3-methyl-5-hydroxy-6-metoxy-1,4-benzoquinol methylase